MEAPLGAPSLAVEHAGQLTPALGVPRVIAHEKSA